jgi:hypothetical protein
MSQAFYKEQTRWPFVHAVVPLALYFATRNIILSLLLIYVWETAERLLKRVTSYFSENDDDSLIGDPLIGSLSIFSFWVFDQATGWDTVICENTNPWLRAACFLLIAVVSPIVELDKSKLEARGPHLGTLAYALYYYVIALLFYTFAFTDPPAVGQSVAAWLAIVFIYALVAAAPLWVDFSLFMRIFMAEVFVTMVAAIFLVIRN